MAGILREGAVDSMASRTRACWITVVALAATSVGGPALAQGVPVVLVSVRGAPQDEGVPAVNRVASAIGPDALTGSALAARLTRTYGSRPAGGDPLAQARQRVQSGIAAWSSTTSTLNDAAANRALDEIDAAARVLEQNPEALDHSEDSRRALRDALVFLAERGNASGNATRLDDAVQRLVRADPSVTFGPRDASEAVRRAYASALAALPRGELMVDSVPPGCTVYRDGRLAGTAPVELQDLPPGAHRVSVECGAVSSLVHPIEVAPRTRSTLVVDTQLDAELAFEPLPTLRYATLAEAEARLPNDLVVLGRALAVRRVYGVVARQDVVRVVDVANASLVGESPVADGSRVRLLLTEYVSTPVHPVASPEPRASASPGPVEAIRARPPQHVTVRHRVSVPAAAIVLGALGVAALGVSAYAALHADADETRALQTGGLPSENPSDRTAALNSASVFRWVEWGTLAGGGALVLTGVLYGIFGRTETTETVQASVSPVRGGALLTVGGRL